MPNTPADPHAGDPNYLVGLDLAGRRVVVVGGGTVAQRRLGLLIASGADVHVISRAVTPAVEGMATSGQLTLHLRDYADGDLEDAWYAIACTDEPETNAAIVAEATARRVFCVRADVARLGTAVTPATARYDGMTLGVLAGGQHRRSAAVRTALLEALQSGVVSDDAAPPTPRVARVGGGPGGTGSETVRGRAFERCTGGGWGVWRVGGTGGGGGRRGRSTGCRAHRRGAAHRGV
ncbi:precorrin-2 dehydrogenase/sirohydrochlorin ferrochelatase family protein, partial [Nocardia wallacei]|uniref:precorrin-2 dehydrogenase/sirohydrochlorin ferrochelatase family protein n=1 Tax=Nocardia wallacei TaxID=480035 RepID=UPI002455061E